MKVIIDSKHLNQTGENLKIDLQDIIDNRNDDYVAAVRDISYYVGYYNISKALGNNRAVYSDGKITNNVFLPGGLYTLQQYFDVIKMLLQLLAVMHHILYIVTLIMMEK